MLRHVAEAIGPALFAAVLLVAIRSVVRRVDVAVVICTVFLALGAPDLPAGPMAVRLVWAAVAAAATYALLLRLGILTVSATAFVVLLLLTLPLTIDPDVWCFSGSAVVLAIPVTLVVFAFVLSLGGKRALLRLEMD